MNIADIARTRYTTKAFDPSRRIADDLVAQIETLLRYSPSSTNSQPWHFFIAGSDEGKALFAELRAADPAIMLPTILLSPDVEKDTEGAAALSRFLRPLGNYRELKLGGQHDPMGEICKNAGDEDGNGAADCADDKCKATLGCRPAVPGTLDMFVMSQCPYGAQAMMAAAEIAPVFGKDLTVNVHFIGDGDVSSLQSMHGPPEVEEDIREICAAKKYPKDNQFLKYLACRSKDYKSMEWKGCAKEAGMDEAVIQACYDGEGKQLLADTFKFASLAEIGSGGSNSFGTSDRITDLALGDAVSVDRVASDDDEGGER